MLENELQRPESADPTNPAPTYNPSEATKPVYKKYGYKPSKPTNPTIWRQQVMKVLTLCPLDLSAH